MARPAGPCREHLAMHDGYLIAETLEQDVPFEFKGDVVDMFNDELMNAVRNDLLSSQ
jgi:hypothetical protein